MSDEIRYPTGFGLCDIVAWGNSGLVCLDRSSQTVIKSPHEEETEEAVRIERKIYERFSELGGHDGLLHYYGPYESGIRLEYAAKGPLRSFLINHAQDVDFEQRLHWAEQISSALHFIHSGKVVHGDLTCSNVFLDRHLNAKLADFGGSSLNGSPLLVAVTASHRYPGPTSSTQGDIFALGSTIYEIITGATPYNNLSEEKILDHHAKGEFADTASLGAIGSIIARCWKCQYKSANAVLKDIQEIRQRKSPVPLCADSSTLLFTVTATAVVALVFASFRSARFSN